MSPRNHHHHLQYLPKLVCFHLLMNPVAKLLLTDSIYDYHYQSQGKVEIPGVNDGEEFKDVDVSCMSVVLSVF